MSITPSPAGFVQRSANLPTNAAGWTFCFWMRSAGTSGSRQTLLEMNDGATSYVNLNIAASGTQLRYEHDGGATTNLFSITTGTWYFVALSLVTTTTCQVRYKASGDTALTAVTSLASSNVTWALMTLFGNGVPGVDIADQIQMFGFKLFTKSLSDAEMWEQSVRLLPRCAPADIDSYLPFYVASATDESGRGRNWSTAGTMGPFALQPSISRGGGLGPRRSSAASAGVSSAIAGSLSLAGAAAVQVRDDAAIAGAFALTASAAMQVTNRAQLAGAMSLLGAATLQTTLPVSMAGSFSISAAAGVQVANRALLAGMLSFVGAAQIASGGGSTGPRYRLRDRQRGRDRRRR